MDLLYIENVWWYFFMRPLSFQNERSGSQIYRVFLNPSPWLLRDIVFLVQSLPKEGLNWPKLTNVCKLGNVWKVYSQWLPLHSKRERKKLDKCVQTQWSVLPTVTVSQQAKPFDIRDDYLSKDTRGNNWLRRIFYNRPSNNWWPIITHVVFSSHIFNSSTETNF